MHTHGEQGRIAMLERDQVTPKLGLLYDKLLHDRGARQVFDDKQMIELSAVAAAFEFFPRFVNALAIPVTPIPDAAMGE